MAAQRIGVFWFRRRPNFGDALAPLLVQRFAGLEPYWAPPLRSDAVVIGSIAGQVAKGYRGVVIGIGLIEDGIELDLSTAKVLGLRGALTRELSGLKTDIVLGDPGLLAADLIDERPRQEHALGIVAHLNDAALRQRYPDALGIDVGSDPVSFVRQVASCERIVSSSLHGLITADSLGIPRRWEVTEGARGRGFKFRDYSTALGIAIEPDTWVLAPARQVERLRGRLRDVFAELPATLPAERRAAPSRLRRFADNVAWRLSTRS